jgi:hypothetical protein
MATKQNVGLFSDLFNKSENELDKLENPKPAKKKATPEQLEKLKKDRLLRDRIRQLRIKEGRDPNTGKLVNAFLSMNKNRA